MNTKLLVLVNKARWRQTRGILPMSEIAAKCGLTRYHLWKLLHADTVPRSETRTALAKGLGCTRAAIDACWGDK